MRNSWTRVFPTACSCSCTVGKKTSTIQYGYMAVLNVELKHECFLKHSRMGTARMKQDKETDEEGKMRGVSMERSKASMKEKELPKPITT